MTVYNVGLMTQANMKSEWHTGFYHQADGILSKVLACNSFKCSANSLESGLMTLPDEFTFELT